MIYGMYLSATGVITNSYRQDVIANNLANADTVGFKKDLATFRQRPTASAENPLAGRHGSPLLDGIGGGTFADPTAVDTSPGDLESTGNPLDAAIIGNGYFAVQGKDGQPRLTRDGQFQLDRDGRLTLANAQGSSVLDAEGHPIILGKFAATQITADGRRHAGRQAGRPPRHPGSARPV